MLDEIFELFERDGDGRRNRNGARRGGFGGLFDRLRGRDSDPDHQERDSAAGEDRAPGGRRRRESDWFEFGD